MNLHWAASWKLFPGGSDFTADGRNRPVFSFTCLRAFIIRTLHNGATCEIMLKFFFLPHTYSITFVQQKLPVLLTALL